MCESYAETYFMLLNYFDVPSYIVIGIAGSGRDYENHAWNLIQIENKWYYVDVTWDDCGADKTPDIVYNYFAVGSDTIMKNSHKVNQSGLISSDSGTNYMVTLPSISTSDLQYS